MTRWSEFLAAYSYSLTHKPGKKIAHADALSRSPLPDFDPDPAPTTNTLTIEDCPNLPITASDIAMETGKDKRLARILNWVAKGWPERDDDDSLRTFRNRQTELSLLKGCILWGDRVVIPDKLQNKVLEMLHEGHPGIVRTKALARSYAWWPGMDKHIETWVAKCKRCQETRSSPPAAPIRDWETPRGPWSRIHLDFAGPTNGHTFLITVDAYSNWLEVSDMRSTTTEAVCKELCKLFATHGLPDVVVSDNGPQFTSLDFEKFLAERGIRHALTAPAHPAANGRAERMVQFTKKTLRKMDHGEINDKINRLLFVQHITPNSTTNKSPAELLMGRKLRSPLDRLHPTYNPERPPDSSTRYRTFAPGDLVYAKNLTGDPLWIPAVITQITGPRSYRLQTTDGRAWKRHIDQLRSRTTTEPTPHDANQGGREQPAKTQEKIIQQYLPERSHQESPPERSHPASSTNPVDPGGSGETRGSTEPVGPGGSHGESTGPVTQQDEGAAKAMTVPDKIQHATELRRSNRTRRRPAYLRDYTT